MAKPQEQNPELFKNMHRVKIRRDYNLFLEACIWGESDFFTSLICIVLLFFSLMIDHYMWLARTIGKQPPGTETAGAENPVARQLSWRWHDDNFSGLGTHQTVSSFR